MEIKLFAYTPFIITGFLAEMNPANTFVEYGALGICAFTVWMLFKQLADIQAAHVLALETQNENHRKERQELVLSLKELNAESINILERNIKITTNIMNALHERPCLIKDSRVNEIND